MRPRLLEEICTLGKIDETYHATLEAIILRIEKDGCQVMTRTDISSSTYEAYPNGLRIARVSLKDVDDPMNIIWRLLHEYGHYKSGERNNSDRTIDREERAWKEAERLIADYPDLLARKDHFTQCREHDLGTYRKHLGLL